MAEKVYCFQFDVIFSFCKYFLPILGFYFFLFVLYCFLHPVCDVFPVIFYTTSLEISLSISFYRFNQTLMIAILLDEGYSIDLLHVAQGQIPGDTYLLTYWMQLAVVGGGSHSVASFSTLWLGIFQSIFLIGVSSTHFIPLCLTFYNLVGFHLTPFRFHIELLCFP